MSQNDAYWKDKLTSDQYKVLRKKDTEAAFSGKYYKHNERGVYVCAACGQPLFSSETKFDSGSGWPSFTNVVEKSSVNLKKDDSFGMSRVEVLCSSCDGHLGHLFDDGPTSDGKRFCINSESLGFKEENGE